MSSCCKTTDVIPKLLIQLQNSVIFLKGELEKTQTEKVHTEALLENCQEQLRMEISRSNTYAKEINKMKYQVDSKSEKRNDVTFDISFDNDQSDNSTPKRRCVAFDIPQQEVLSVKEPDLSVTPKPKKEKISNILSSAMKVMRKGTALPKSISMDSLNMKVNGPPYVPPAIVACMTEIESRGKTSRKLHTDAGSTKEVMKVQKKLHNVDDMNSLLAGKSLDVISTCMKQLISYVSEPLVTDFFRIKFLDLLKLSKGDISKKLEELCRSMSGVNRDTLAFLIIHLTRVAEFEDCRTSVDDLCSVFAPIVMESSIKTDSITLHHKRYKDIQVMKLLMGQSYGFWCSVMQTGHNGAMGRCGILGTYLSKHM